MTFKDRYQPLFQKLRLASLRPSSHNTTKKQCEDVCGQSVKKPIMTLDGANRYGVVAPAMVKYYGSDKYGQSADEPLHTITARDREGLIIANITKFFGGGYNGSGSDMKDPLPTVTTTDHNGLELAHICKFKGLDLGQHPETPLHTITATAGEFAAIHTRIVRYQSDADLGHWPEARTMLNVWCGYNLAKERNYNSGENHSPLLAKLYKNSEMGNDAPQESKVSSFSSQVDFFAFVW